MMNSLFVPSINFSFMIHRMRGNMMEGMDQEKCLHKVLNKCVFWFWKIYEIPNLNLLKIWNVLLIVFSATFNLCKNFKSPKKCLLHKNI